MNYIKFSRWDTANGKGIGVVLWVSGCSHHCEQCHNPETWNPREGQLWTSRSMDELLEYLVPTQVKRFTLSGGDPLYPANRSLVEHIVKRVKTQYPDKSIWLYTGFRFEEIADWQGLQYVDVLVDGRFEIAKKDLTLPFSGSTNQRVINVPETLKQSHIVLL